MNFPIYWCYISIVMPDGYVDVKKRNLRFFRFLIPFLLCGGIFNIYVNATRPVPILYIFGLLFGGVLILLAFFNLISYRRQLHGRDGIYQKKYRVGTKWTTVRRIQPDKNRIKQKYGRFFWDIYYNTFVVSEIIRVLAGKNIKYRFWESTAQIPIRTYRMFEAIIVDLEGKEVLIGMEVTPLRYAIIYIWPVTAETDKPVFDIAIEIDRVLLRQG